MPSRLALGGLQAPHVEAGILISLLALGFMVRNGSGWPVGATAAVVALFGALHGVAHGSELALAGPAFTTGAGMVSAAGLLHFTGYLAGVSFQYHEGVFIKLSLGSQGGLLRVPLMKTSLKEQGDLP